MGLLAYLGLFWALSFLYHRFLSGRKRRSLRSIKLFRKNLLAKIRLDSDILLEKNLDALKRSLEEIDDALKHAKDRTIEELEKLSKGLSKRVEKACPTKSNTSVRETIEMLVVVFGIVMGIRAIIMQPFKIPTGSMQPTLFGIHFDHKDTVEKPGPVKAFFDWINYSAHTTDVVVRRDGHGTYVRDGSSKIGPITMVDKTVVGIGSETYELPGPLSAVRKISPLFDKDVFVGYEFHEGELLARGVHLTGDHIMVDRLSYRFIEPKRGDVFVFVTDGIRKTLRDRYGKVIMDANGKPRKAPLSGRHYIKRLVGLPGDTLKISEGKLLVMEKGETTFVPMDKRFGKAFARIYSGKGGYHGYTCRGTHKYFKQDGDIVKLENDQYFAMGDNSAFSSDSRDWGVVPRKNIIGRALLVWWPFSRRWGWIDRAEPEDVMTKTP